LELNGSGELGEDSLGGQVKNGSIEDVSILQDSGNLHFILERINLQFIKKSSLGLIDLSILEDNLLFGNDINLTFDNLCLDLKSLEETGLFWIKTGWANWY
jgi:hypothetical protein